MSALRNSNNARRDSTHVSKNVPHASSDSSLTVGPNARKIDERYAALLNRRSEQIINQMIKRRLVEKTANGSYQISNELCRRIITNLCAKDTDLFVAIGFAVRSYYRKRPTGEQIVELVRFSRILCLMVRDD